MTRRRFLLDVSAAAAGLAAAALWATQRTTKEPETPPSPTPMPPGGVMVAPMPAPSPSAVSTPMQIEGKVAH